MKEAIGFLKGLDQNNNREWFQASKPVYEACRTKILAVTGILIHEIRKFDGDVPPLDPADCLFRIYRDVRFSSDKRPYKTHFGSYIARGGRKSTRAGYYFHIEPGGSFLGGGVYLPGPLVLKALRNALYENPQQFLDITGDPLFRSYYPAIEGEKLKTNPKGFDPGFEHMDLLRYKSYVFSYPLPDSILLQDSFTGTATEAFKALAPVNRFLNDAMDNYL